MAPSEKAQKAKEQGNAAFKVGDYPTAIGHYSAAIIEDRKDPTFPLNRAAAYLKLGKNEDAERDCTTVLSLSPSNVKAIFRRGQARFGMGKLDEAKADFEAAAKMEPNNQAVKDELEKIQLLAQKKASKSTTGMSGPPDPRRRRVPIQIIDSPQGTPPVSREATSPQVQQSQSTPTPTPPSESPSAPIPSASPAPPKTFQEAKRAREETKPAVRVGGGIFRASGKNTLFGTKGKDDSPASPSATSSTRDNARPVANLFELSRAWGSASSSAERFQLIQNVDPSTYPSLFKTSLEPSLLISIVQTFLDVLSTDLDPDARDFIGRSMEGLLHVPRISTIALFLSGTEKDVVKSVLQKLDDAVLTDLWRSVLKY
ncbi:hypothetical protein VNI00_015919 [Paramarasmius palmivorus]|uniref:RNA polymerase II-associated protein 3 n=1 Tax=Paramarasmius palmivorus TaxID=297713 RepID=A0AAW0BHJ9_9AGAR